MHSMVKVQIEFTYFEKCKYGLLYFLIIFQWYIWKGKSYLDNLHILRIWLQHFNDQVQIGSHSFTFDHVYGNGGSPSSEMFEECVAPLVDGLFQGFNATVLAYGQVLKVENDNSIHIFYSKHILAIRFMVFIWSTYLLQTGSGKTYTMGTAYNDNSGIGLIPQVMNALFNKIETLKHQTEFQLHVSFIEVYCTLLSNM